MGEPFLIQEALQKGIRSTHHDPRNSQRLVTLRGGKAMPYAVVPYVPPTNPLAAWMASAGITVALPSPQFFRTTLATLLITETSIYLIDEVAWTGTLQTVEDFYERASGHDYTVVTAGGRWTVADAQGLLVIQNAKNFIVYRDGVFYGVTGFAALTGCYHYHQGRLLLAGFSNTALTFYSRQWQAVEAIVNTKATSVNLIGATTLERWIWWSSLLGGNILELFDAPLALYGPNGLGVELCQDSTLRYGATAWTLAGGAALDAVNDEIDLGVPGTASQPITCEVATYVVGFELRHYTSGTAKFTFGGVSGTARSVDGHYFEEIAIAAAGAKTLQISGPSCSVTNISVRKKLSTTHGLTKPWLPEHELRNDSNEIPMRWPGQVYALKSLGKSVIAYCKDGVSALTPTVDPPVYGDARLLDVGIRSRGAVDGDEQKHLYVDGAGWTWLIGDDLKVVPLDYHELFENMGNVYVAYDAKEDEFHICGVIGTTTYSYVYTPGGGMSETPRCVTSLAVIGGKAQGVTAAADRFTDFELVTDTFDIGSRIMKTVTEVEVGLSSGGTAMTVHLDYHLSHAETTWRPGTTFTLRGKGSAYTKTTGTEFRLSIIGPAYAAVEIDYIKIHWELAAKVSIKELIGA